MQLQLLHKVHTTHVVVHDRTAAWHIIWLQRGAGEQVFDWEGACAELDIEVMDDCKAKILMKDYLLEAIEDFKEDVTKIATSVTGKTLFEIDKKSSHLSK